MPPLTPATICAEAGDLERRRRVAVVALEAVAAERAGLARAVAGGDPLALARVEWLNARSGELAGEIDRLTGDKLTAGEDLGELLEARQRGVGAVRRPDPVAVARALLAESRRVDAAMVTLATALAGRAALARRLTGIGRGHAQIANPARVVAAAGHHGLGDFIDLGRCLPRLYAPLAIADELALSALLKPVSATAERERAA